MSILETNILTITEPTIELEPFEIVDIESSSEKNKKAGTNNDILSKDLGDTYPAIRVNGYNFGRNDIFYFELNLDEFIPKMNVTIIDNKGIFTINQYPMDGDTVELLISAKDDDTYKPIRMDFDIISINSDAVSSENQGMSDSGANAQKITFICQAKIPGLFSEKCESYSINTSFNHLQEMCNTLQIGFASNSVNTNDTQIRYCAYETPLKYIQREVLHSYKNDDSFFTVYIDPYYYLNFVNVNQQLKLEDNVEDTFISLISSIKEKGMQDLDTDRIKTKLILTNHNNVGKETSNYIYKYTLINNSGQVFLKNGYKRVVQYYNQDTREYNEFKLDTLTADNLPANMIPLKGKNDETRYNDEIKYKYLGLQSDIENNGNMHANYNYAKILNFQNNEELEKLKLKVILPTANMSLYRYQKIPVAIYERDATRTEVMRKKAEKSGIEQDTSKDEKSNKANSYKLNIFYSGFYIISKIKYIYKASRAIMQQELILTKREWPIPI